MLTKNPYKIFMLLIVLFTTPKSFAINFAFDNYTDNQNLYYSYSFDAITWTRAGYLPSGKEPPYGYIELNFPQIIPLAWKIEAYGEKKLECTDYVSSKPSTNVVRLKKLEYQNYDNLLLDVVEVVPRNINKEFMVSIINLDGGGPYSNTLKCRIVHN